MAKGMHLFKKRLMVLVGSALTATVLLGLFAPSPAALLVGLVVIGLVMILGLLNYLLRPIPSEAMPMYDVTEDSDGDARSERAHQDVSAPAGPRTSLVQLSVIRNPEKD